MFNKTKVKTTIKEILKEDEYILLMGGSLVMNDIRKTTNDLDIGVTKEAFQRLKKNHEVKIAKWTGDKTVEYDDMELFEKEELHEIPSEVVDGVRVQTLESVVEWKERGGRPKDIRDIKLIKEHKQK